MAWDDELILRAQPGEPPPAKDETPFDIFHALIGGLYDTQASPREREAFSVRSQRAVIGASAISRGVWGAQTVYRRAKHLKTQDAEFVGIRLTVGSSITIVGDEVFIQKDPAVVLSDFSSIRMSKSARTRSSRMYLPHSLVGYDPSLHPSEIVVPLNTPKGRILKSYISTSVREIVTQPSERKQARVTHAAALFRGLLLDDFTEEARSTFRTARAAAMRDFLRAQLRNPRLGIDHVMVAFGASRATIFRDFEPFGGVAEFIATERLKRIALDMVEREPARGVVSSVSDDWGFQSVQDFSRLFRRRLGMAPSDIIGLNYLPTSF